jgi:hypothetical protein
VSVPASHARAHVLLLRRRGLALLACFLLLLWSFLGFRLVFGAVNLKML